MKKGVLYFVGGFMLAVPVTFAATDEDTFKMLNLFGDVFEKVRTDYVEEVEDSKLIESAINGMLVSLDPHSGYLDEKSFDDMQVQTRGEFGGLGIEVTMENGLVKVVSPIDDTPAYRAGIESGDFISQINDEPVMGLTLAEAVEKMRGPAGTEITLTIIREGLTEPLEVKLTRAVVKIQSVRARAEGDVAYLRITSFSEQTASGLKKAFEDTRKEIGPGLKGVVLDLRNNPGGLLDQAIAVSDAFLEQGEVVSTRGRTEDSIKRFNAVPGDMTGGLPVVVLINPGSASASEIVSGALQDHKRAIVMGEKSFGKGSVQTVIPMPGHGAIRLTTSRYYTPSGRSIQAKGIEPDIEVKQAKIEEVKVNGMFRSEDSLKGRLDNEDELKKKDKEQDKPKDKEKDKEKDKSGKPEASDKDAKTAAKAGDKEDKSKNDYQLARALDLIRGLALYHGNGDKKADDPSAKPTDKP